MDKHENAKLDEDKVKKIFFLDKKNFHELSLANFFDGSSFKLFCLFTIWRKI
jgi:hypothetical protein